MILLNVKGLGETLIQASSFGESLNEKYNIS